MAFYIRPFTIKHEECIVNDGEECFKFISEHLDEFKYLSKISGKVVDSLDIKNNDAFENEYSIVVSQNDDFISNVKIFSDIENEIELIFRNCMLSKKGKTISILLYQDIETYYKMIHKNYDTDYIIGAFVINNVVYISSVYCNKGNSPCLKCHFLNHINNFYDDFITDSELVKFIKYIMREKFSDVATKRLLLHDQKLISLSIFNIIMKSNTKGYSYAKDKRDFSYYLDLNNIVLSSTKSRFNFNCECLYEKT